jgi:hypothetical protein
VIRSSRRCATAATTLLTAALLPLTALPALASTEPVAAPLPAPSALSPDDSGAAYPHAVLKTVRLNWAAVSGATGYRVEVGRDSTWSDTPVLTQNVVSSELTLPTYLPHASYVWRVAAVKGSTLGHWSSESTLPQSDAEFTRGWHVAPGPVAPVGDQGTDVFPEFSWTPIATASGYQVEVSDAPFANPATATPDTTPAPGSQVQPNGNVDSCFTVRTRITFFTKHVAHGEGDVGPCYSSLLGGGNQLYWRVRGLDRFVGTAADSQTTPGSQNISTMPPNGKPDPKVGSDCPKDTGGGCAPGLPSEFSEWSASIPFKTTYTGPLGSIDTNAVVVTASLAGNPDAGCTVDNAASTQAEHATCVDVPTISWNSVANATRYRITIALDDAFSNVQRISDTYGNQWTPADAWPDSTPGTSYYYAVQACDDTVCGAVSSTPPSFRKVTPRPTVGARPAVTGEFTLSWQSYAALLTAKTGQVESQDAYAYRVQVASSDHPAYDVVVDDVVVDGTSYASPDKVYPDGSYVWRVQAIDSSGHRLPFSLSQSFTRDATGPRVVSVSPSSKVSVSQALHLVFSEPTTGLSSSSVTLSPATPTTLSVLDSTHATLVPTQPLVPGSTYTVTVASTVKDLAGNSALASGPAVTVSPAVDDGNAALRYSSGWSVLASSNAVGGKFHSSKPTPSYHPSATLAFRGTGVSLTACVGPANGLVDIYVDGVRKAHVSSYRSFSGCGVKVAALTGLTRSLHTVRVVGAGSHVGASKGNAIGLDALTVTP